MKNNVLALSLVLMASLGLFGQNTGSMIVAVPGSMPASVPRYILYRHFLGWVNSLYTSANAGAQLNAADPYQFAQPFAHASLSQPSLDALVKEAKAMTADLAVQDGKIATAVAALRVTAKAALQSGQPLPPVPPALRLLQQQRIGLLVQHMINLQTNLGPTAAISLDGYIDREFAPRVSLKALAHPASANTLSAVGP